MHEAEAQDESRPGVLFLASTLPIGGAEEVIHLIVKGLLRSRYRPVVCCLRDPGAMGEEIRNLGIPVYSGLLSHRWDVVVLSRLMTLMKGEKVKVLYCLDHDNAMFWGRVAARLAGIPVSVTAIHTYGKWGGRRSISRTNRWLLPLTQKVIAVAHKQRDYLVKTEELDPALVEVIPNGIEIERFTAVENRLGSREKRVALIATIRPEKGHDIFLKAAAEVVSKDDRAVFWVVGDGPGRRALEALAGELQVSASVSFLGFRRDIPDLLAQTDIVVLSSHASVETFPVSLLEAMAAGKPVVATRVGAVDELVVDGETGYLVEPGNPQALARAILSLVHDEALARRLGAAGRARVRQHFSADLMVERTEALFDTLMARASAN